MLSVSLCTRLVPMTAVDVLALLLEKIIADHQGLNALSNNWVRVLAGSCTRLFRAAYDCYGAWTVDNVRQGNEMLGNGAAMRTEFTNAFDWWRYVGCLLLRSALVSGIVSVRARVDFRVRRLGHKPWAVRVAAAAIQGRSDMVRFFLASARSGDNRSECDVLYDDINWHRWKQFPSYSLRRDTDFHGATAYYDDQCRLIPAPHEDAHVVGWAEIKFRWSTKSQAYRYMVTAVQVLNLPPCPFMRL